MQLTNDTLQSSCILLVTTIKPIRERERVVFISFKCQVIFLKFTDHNKLLVNILYITEGVSEYMEQLIWLDDQYELVSHNTSHVVWCKQF